MLSPWHRRALPGVCGYHSGSLHVYLILNVKRDIPWGLRNSTNLNKHAVAIFMLTLRFEIKSIFLYLIVLNVTLLSNGVQTDLSIYIKILFVFFGVGAVKIVTTFSCVRHE